MFLAQAPLNIVILSDDNKLQKKYSQRGKRYAHIEAGHIAQNILLEATALDLQSIPIGAFDDEKVQQAIHAPLELTPIYIIAVGH